MSLCVPLPQLSVPLPLTISFILLIKCSFISNHQSLKRISYKTIAHFYQSEQSERNQNGLTLSGITCHFEYKKDKTFKRLETQRIFDSLRTTQKRSQCIFVAGPNKMQTYCFEMH